MDKLTYHDLVQRYGQEMAYDLLLIIEKMARMKTDVTCSNENVRLQKALIVLNDQPLNDCN